MNPAPVTYCGWQELYPSGGCHTYNLTADIPGHPAKSTVAEKTLLDAGYQIPEGMPCSLPVGCN